jgi:hypothetical protein
MRSARAAAVLALVGGVLLLNGCRKAEKAAPAASTDAAAAPVPLSEPEPTPPPESVTDELTWAGQDVTVAHSFFDIGRVHDVLDGDPQSLARTARANPAVLDITFSKPRALRGIDVATSTMDVGVKAVVTLAGGGEKTYSKEYRELPNDPTVRLDFEGLSGKAEKLRVEISNLRGGDGHIHIRSLDLR